MDSVIPIAHGGVTTSFLWSIPWLRSKRVYHGHLVRKFKKTKGCTICCIFVKFVQTILSKFVQTWYHRKQKRKWPNAFCKAWLFDVSPLESIDSSPGRIWRTWTSSVRGSSVCLVFWTARHFWSSWSRACPRFPTSRNGSKSAPRLRCKPLHRLFRPLLLQCLALNLRVENGNITHHQLLFCCYWSSSYWILSLIYSYELDGNDLLHDVFTSCYSNKLLYESWSVIGNIRLSRVNCETIWIIQTWRWRDEFISPRWRFTVISCRPTITL